MFIKELEQEDAVVVLFVVEGGDWGSSSRWRGGSRNRCL